MGKADETDSMGRDAPSTNLEDDRTRRFPCVVPLQFFSEPTRSPDKPILKPSSYTSPMKVCNSISEINTQNTPSTQSLLTLDEVSSVSSFKTSVSFQSVEIREYEVTIGDNPSCRKGVPIGLSWNYNPLDSIDIAEYETRKGGRRRRSKKRLIVDEKKREIMLNEHNKEDIARVKKEIAKVQHSRKMSVMFGGILECKEYVGRSFKRATSCNSRSVANSV